MGAYHSTPSLLSQDGALDLPPGAVERRTLTTLMSITMYQSATLAFVLYDILLTLPAEVEMYRTRGFKSIVTPAFVISRWTSSGCHAITGAMVALLLVLATATTVLFGVRTWAMCYRNRWVLVLIGLLTLGQFIGNTVMATWMRPAAFQGLCLLEFEAAHQGKYWWFYVNSMVVSAVLFFLALGSLFMDGSGQWLLSVHAPIKRRLLQDGVIYFVCLVAVNVLNVAFILAAPLMRWRAMNITLCTAITSLCSTRLVLHKLSLPTTWKLRRMNGARTRAPAMREHITTHIETGVHEPTPLAFHDSHASLHRGRPETRSSLPVSYTVETHVLRTPADEEAFGPAPPADPQDDGRSASSHPGLR